MKNGFDFKLTINSIEKVTPRVSGESEIDGNEITWGHAVKFSSRSIIDVPDKEFGIKDEEVAIEIEITCDSKAEVTNLNEFLRKLRTDPKPFNVDAYLPKYSVQSKMYKTKSKLKGMDFIKLFDLKK